MPITLKNVSHVYMPGSEIAHTALNNISLEIKEGEFFSIIGHTGSGKTTLLLHMNGLITAQQGSIYVDTLNLSDKKQRFAARGLVGMVFQYPEYQLFEETVYKDVAFGPKNMGVPPENIPGRVEEALFRVGLNPDIFANKSPFDLSGGEKRRAALAGILAMKPKYLLLDEPMAGLDPKGRRSIINLLQSLRKETGCAIVMISHSMDEVANNADRIALLKGGELMLLDTPKNVFKDPGFLLDMGLDLPQAAKLALKLHNKGMKNMEGIYQQQALINALKEVL